MSEQPTEIDVAAAVELEKTRILRRHAVLLAALARTPAFTFLFDEVEKKRGRIKAAITSRLMGGEGMDTLQRQIDYDRGFIDGMAYPRQVVEGAVKTVEGIEREEVETTTGEERSEDGWPGYDRDTTEDRSA